jgi:hypothetical protein
VVLLLTALFLSGSQISAQQPDSDDQPAIAMGSGRMIRGTVTATAPDRITLKTESGETYAVALTPNTTFRHGRDPIKLADIHAGDGIGALGELDRPNKTVHALFVQIVTAAEVKKMRDDLGKTWIAGTVTALDETKITILRSDRVTQTIQVDEDTSFKRGGRNMQAMLQGGEAAAPQPAGRQGAAGAQAPPAESITLLDVKVGDLVAGPGALKSGVFFAKELTVGEPGAGGAGRRRRPEGAQPGSGPNASAIPPTEPR